MAPAERRSILNAFMRWYILFLTVEDLLEFLESTELLSKVPKDRLAEIAVYFQPVSIPTGAVIFREGDAGDALYIVGEGQVRVERDCIPVAIRRSGDCVGEMALLDQSPRSSTLVAQTDTRLLRLSAEDFARIAASSPEVTSGIHRVLAAKLRESLPKRDLLPPNEPTRVITNSETTPGLLLPAHLEGTTFAGRYRIQTILGRGGMAYVYRADDQLLGVPVAVKVLHRIGERPIVDRFKQEVVLARKVVHRNVCRIFDFGEFAGLSYVSMELIGGTTLTEKIRVSGRLSIVDALPILRQVLSALEEVHRLGIVHRDIKPHNIMLEPSGRAVIMDFGIALYMDAPSRNTLDGQFVGTLHYMAPEQFEAEGPDHRADLYAMGVVLFEMFTGKRPFETGSTTALMAAHLNTPPPAPQLEPDLDRIILKALEKQRERRYQSAAELLADLNKLQR